MASRIGVVMIGTFSTNNSVMSGVGESDGDLVGGSVIVSTARMDGMESRVLKYCESDGGVSYNSACMN